MTSIARAGIAVALGAAMGAAIGVAAGHIAIWLAGSQ